MVWSNHLIWGSARLCFAEVWAESSRHGVAGLTALTALTRLVLLAPVASPSVIDLASHLPALDHLELQFGTPISAEQAVRNNRLLIT